MAQPRYDHAHDREANIRPRHVYNQSFQSQPCGRLYASRYVPRGIGEVRLWVIVHSRRSRGAWYEVTVILHSRGHHPPSHILRLNGMSVDHEFTVVPSQHLAELGDRSLGSEPGG